MAAVISNALLPSPFVSDDKAQITVNRDYLLDARVTRQAPKQVVTLRLNPRARWSDGQPITWADYQAQWHALKGDDPDFHLVSATGYQDIAKVRRGRDDHEVVVTFARPFGDWKALFSPLLPASTNRTPEAFDTAWLNKIPVTAGPFRFGGFDQTAKTITILRDDNWWGERAKLDRIIYRAAEQDSLIGMFGNGELDIIDVGTSAPDYARAQATPGARVRQAAGPDFRHFTFNASSDPLRDVRVRQAVQLGIDRQAIARSDLQGLDWPSTPLNNHFFMNTQTGYQDNAGDLGAYDPERAGRLLDQAGWKLDGAVRKKDGQPARPALRRPVGGAAEQGRGRAGAEHAHPDRGEALPPGGAERRLLHQVRDPRQLRHHPVRLHRHPVPGLQQLRRLRERARRQDVERQLRPRRVRGHRRGDGPRGPEPRPGRGRADVNAADKLIWKQASVLPLYQRPQLVAVRETLANVGARGFHELRYQDIGFVR